MRRLILHGETEACNVIRRQAENSETEADTMTTTAAMTSQLARSDLLDTYTPSQTASYDELLASDGTPRRHWQPFLNELNALTNADRKAMAARLDRRVRET